MLARWLGRRNLVIFNAWRSLKGVVENEKFWMGRIIKAMIRTYANFGFVRWRQYVDLCHAEDARIAHQKEMEERRDRLIANRRELEQGADFMAEDLSAAGIEPGIAG